MIEEFLKEYLKRSLYVDRETLVNTLSGIELLLRKGKSVEEIIDLLIKDILEQFENTRKKYGVPGYTASINVNNIKVKLYGGNINYLGEEMKENALFDIASMTKFYTQIIAYKLMKENLFKREDKIKELDNRFFNLGDLTVDDILTFGVSFKTNGLIKDKKTISEALDTLYSAQVIDNGKWNYNDIGLMIMKEVMERLSNMSFQSLLEEYIIKPYHLCDTHIIVPNSKFKLITGTPNFKEGKVNDMSANAVGGFSGHAGLFSSSDDLVKLARRVRTEDFIKDAFTPGKLNDAIGKMGNVYTTNPKGLEKTFLDIVETNDSFAIAGSTRVNLSFSSDATYNVLFNPSSMSFSEALERVKQINEERIKKGLIPINPVKEYEFDRNGQLIKYKLIDPRQLLPLNIMEDTVKKMARTTLKIRFLDFYLRNYEKNIEELNIIKKGNS